MVCWPLVFQLLRCVYAFLIILIYIYIYTKYICVVKGTFLKTDPYLKLRKGGVQQSNITSVFPGGPKMGNPVMRRARSRLEEKETLNIYVEGINKRMSK